MGKFCWKWFVRVIFLLVKPRLRETKEVLVRIRLDTLWSADLDQWWLIIDHCVQSTVVAVICGCLLAAHYTRCSAGQLCTCTFPAPVTCSAPAAAPSPLVANQSCPHLNISHSDFCSRVFHFAWYNALVPFQYGEMFNFPFANPTIDERNFGSHCSTSIQCLKVLNVFYMG